MSPEFWRSFAWYLAFALAVFCVAFVVVT